MCGIGGILRTWPAGAVVPPMEASIPEAWLDVIDESIKHRGPDGQGRFRDRAVRGDGSTVDVALVHRRMSIIDHGSGGQPMVSEHGRDRRDGLVAVVFNGCVYNHRELRRELHAKGHRFASDHSDTEVFVHGWREWDIGMLRRVDAMFAVAIWDRARALLLLARDVSGEKPLYLARPLPEAGEAMVFGSCARGVLRAHQAISPNPEQRLRSLWQARVEALRAQGATAGRGVVIEPAGAHAVLGTPVKRVDLRHAELAHWEAMLARPVHPPGDVRVRPWVRTGWSETPPFHGAFECRPGTIQASDDAFESNSAFPSPVGASRDIGNPRRLTVELAEELLSAAVEARLEADVPLGCFLSAGLDSGLVAAFSQRALAKRGGRLHTFTMRMPDKALDESAAAAATAAHLGTDHHELQCSARPAEDLVFLIEQLGLPFGDSSLLPTYWLCRAAHQYIRVALSGDGGDELFCGYRRHQAAPLIEKHGRVAPLLPLWALRARYSGKRLEEARRFVLACRTEGYTALVRLFDAVDWQRLTGEPPRERVHRLVHPGCEDYHTYLPYDLMRKMDTASMAVPIEVRAPFLSAELVRCAHATPITVLMPRGQRKGLLRQVARKHLPAEIVDRPKMGFAIPIGEWFRTDYGGMKTLLLDHLNSAEPWGGLDLGVEINMGFVRRMLDEHVQQKRDHSQRLYMLLVLSIWSRWLASLSRQPSVPL